MISLTARVIIIFYSICSSHASLFRIFALISMITCFTKISCKSDGARTSEIFQPVYAWSTILASGIYAVVDICIKDKKNTRCETWFRVFDPLVTLSVKSTLVWQKCEFNYTSKVIYFSFFTAKSSKTTTTKTKNNDNDDDINTKTKRKQSQNMSTAQLGTLDVRNCNLFVENTPVQSSR